MRVAAALAIVLLAAAAVRAAPPPAYLSQLLAPAPEAAFEQVLAPRDFSFPADHGPHPAYRQEWWYCTGQLTAPAGERFGFELTFFRYALAPPAEPTPAASAWRARQVHVAHFAITDVARARFAAAQRGERDALDLSGSRGAPLAVWVDDWSLVADGAGRWQLHAAQPGYALTLTLDVSAAVPVLNGERGLSVKADEPGAASYYYSLPRVAVTGELTRAGHTVAVSGLAWFDREWGSGGLGAGQVGWDWFALQLDDHSALMYYQLRGRGGERDPHSAGTWVDPSGAAHHLSAAAVAVRVLGQWRSPRGGSYPAGWQLSAPQLDLDLTLRALLPDQELEGPPRYWEGAVEVAGRRGGVAVSGRGYVELVGYAKEREAPGGTGQARPP